MVSRDQVVHSFINTRISLYDDENKRDSNHIIRSLQNSLAVQIQWQDSYQVTFFAITLPIQNFSLYISKLVKKPSQKISVANVIEDYQEYFYMEKVVAKKMTGGKSAMHSK